MSSEELTEEELEAELKPEVLLPNVVTDLAYDYIQKHGIRPTEAMVESWLARINGAYFDGVVTSNGH